MLLLKHGRAGMVAVQQLKLLDRTRVEEVRDE